jgi:hypothetical protein
VKTAANDLELAREAVEAALAARDLAKQNTDAEQQKYELGTTTAFELLSAQTSLATVESSAVDLTRWHRNELAFAGIWFSATGFASYLYRLSGRQEVYGAWTEFEIRELGGNFDGLG